MLSDLRLYQLISPSLPIGGFTYSQGIEWAVEASWISDRETFEDWLRAQMEYSLVSLELPILVRLVEALEHNNLEQFSNYTEQLIAWRETRELRAEEYQRGAALSRLLPDLGVQIVPELEASVKRTQLAGIALAAFHWKIPIEKLLQGHLWSWLENMVMAGVKLIPLGQTQGQQLLMTLAAEVSSLVERALSFEDDQIGSSAPAMAIASSRHEQQYTRLFRS